MCCCAVFVCVFLAVFGVVLVDEASFHQIRDTLHSRHDPR